MATLSQRRQSRACAQLSPQRHPGVAERDDAVGIAGRAYAALKRLRPRKRDLRQSSGIRTGRARTVSTPCVRAAFLFRSTVQQSFFFAHQMQRERGAAITCEVRTLAWIPAVVPLAQAQAARE